MKYYEDAKSTKFNVGDRVKIRGSHADFTHNIDGRMGTVVDVFEKDCLVKVDGSNNFLGGWFIYNENMTLVKEDA